MKYTLAMKALTKADAAMLAPALQRYEIDITKPDLYARWETSDKRYNFDDVEDLIDVMIERDKQEAEKRGEPFEPNREDYYPDWYELDFSFRDVSGERLAWAETNLSKYCVSHDWEIDALYYPQVWQAAQVSPAMPAPTWEQQRKRSNRIIPTNKRVRKNLRHIWRELIA